MNRSTDAAILILAHDDATAGRWAEMLHGPEFWVHRHEHDMPALARPELILTDQDEPTESAPTEVGIVRIGGSGPADVRLPADLTERELRLACRLLAEVVRLRRRLRSGTELQRRLSREASTDPVSGLPNRRAWDETLRERLGAAASFRDELCLAVFDLDHFKRVNDAHGHAAGDEVLRAAGKAIRQGLREEDFVARLGGDEFALLLSLPDAKTAATVVDRVRAALPGRLAEWGTQVVTASAGFHVVAAGNQAKPPADPKKLLAAADEAMRRAKRQGRDRTVGG